jgi:gluconate 5-dehydrogenase
MEYPPIFDLSGSTAIVTGAGGGLGAACAEAMAEAGADVVLVDIDPIGLATTSATIAALGQRALAVECDIADEAAVAAMVAQAIAMFGSIEILINNAGIGDPEPLQIHQYPTDQWNKVMAVNLNGQFFCARAVLQHMVPEKRGKSINIASMWGLAGPSSIFPLPAYAATKGAIVNLTREMALQYAPLGITVNAICPGFYRTNLGPFDDPEFLKAVTDFTPMGRIAEPHEIKGTAIYLASAASNFVTGLMLVADGGCLAK